MRSWKQIVWLASYPKSGNTWVRCFLDAYFLQSVDINDLVCSVADDAGNRITLGDGTDLFEEPLEIIMQARNFGLLRLVSAYMTDNLGVPLFVKTHGANIIANGQATIPKVLTRSIVHIVRDPRDVLPSFATHMGRSLDEATEAMVDPLRVLDGRTQRRVPDIISSWSKNTTSYLSETAIPVLTLRYEDMKAAPVESFSAILTHSGVTPDEARVRAALDAVKLSRLKAQEQEHGFRESSEHARHRFFGHSHAPISLSNQRTLERKFRLVLQRMRYELRRPAPQPEKERAAA